MEKMTFSLDTKMILYLLASFTAGAALGAAYFTGLWWTVRRLSKVQHPSKLLMGSFGVRIAMVLAGFFLIMHGGHWERLAVAMLGFIVVRKILTFALGPQHVAETAN